MCHLRHGWFQAGSSVISESELYVAQSFVAVVLSQGVSLTHREPIAISGDIFDCHDSTGAIGVCREEVGVLLKHPTVHRTAPCPCHTHTDYR